MVKKNPSITKHFKKFQKITFFSKYQEILDKFVFSLKKNAIIFVLPIEEISHQQELFSPPCFRFQGG